MRPIQATDAQLHESVVRAIGSAAVDAAHREGELLAPPQALRYPTAEIARRPMAIAFD